jgi:thioredoxin 1
MILLNHSQSSSVGIIKGIPELPLEVFMKKLLLGLGLVGALAIPLALAQTGTTQSDTMMKSANYVEYTKEAFEKAGTMDKTKRVLFFKASWCPSCRSADEAFNKDVKKIPTNIVIFKADYDKETALKEKYGITRQHTFVYVDAKGMEVKKWSGGALPELLKVVK